MLALPTPPRRLPTTLVAAKAATAIALAALAIGVAVLAALALALSSLAAPAAATAAPPRAAVASAPVLATPPMGWNPWYRFGCNVTETLVMQTADALVSSGMAALGYRYVNVDDCWMAQQRDASGALVADPVKFPHGIAALADYVHARGLKLGIYIDAGAMTCAGYPGSEAHYAQDAATLAAWQVDAVKVDWCHTPAVAAQALYAQMRAALDATGRPMLLEVCNWGIGEPWKWAPGIAVSWRTAGDYNWYGAPQDYWRAVRTVADINGRLGRYARPSAWNDPDILLGGTGLLDDAEGRSQMNLWAMMAAPLLTGADLRTISPATRALLTNRRLIALDQDRAGHQGTLVVKRGPREVWVRRLAGGRRALLLFNGGRRSAELSAGLDHLGLPRARRYLVRNLWSRRSRLLRGRVHARLGPRASAIFTIAARR